MRRLLLALATLALVGMASAQTAAPAPPPAAHHEYRISGGVDLQPLVPQLGVSVNVERPTFDLFGVRWGPVANIKARASPTEVDVQLLTGVGGAIVLPNASWSVKVKLLLHTELQTGQPFSIGPDLQVAFSSKF